MIRMNQISISTKEIYNVSKFLIGKSSSIEKNHVNRFELEFTKLIGSKFSIAVNSGTSALHLSLLALGIGPGDEVIIPAFSFAATANSVLLTGAKVVFADIDLETYNIDIEDMESKITTKTKAVIPVHLYGLPVDMFRIMRIARKYKIFVVEDAAQAHGADVNGKRVGSFGSTGAFSFYYSKNISTYEGGMITTSNLSAFRKINLLRNQGMRIQYINELPGYNNRLTELQAVIGYIQLSKLGEFNSKRIENATYYNQQLRGVKIPIVPKGHRHVYNQYTIRLIDLDRNKFRKELLRYGVEAKVYYPSTLNKLPYLKNNVKLKNAELASKSVLSIPIRPNLKSSELDRVINAVNKIAKFGA